MDEATVAAAREAARADREQATRAMTHEGIMLLVDIRIGYQPRFDISADNSNAIWERIHHDFQHKARASLLPASDFDRGVSALKSLWAKYYGEAKLWSAKAQRAVSLSGVPADEVEEKVVEHYNVTTTLFLKAGMCNRPMAQPPWQMSGESAGMGGLGAIPLGPVAASLPAREDITPPTPSSRMRSMPATWATPTMLSPRQLRAAAMTSTSPSLPPPLPMATPPPTPRALPPPLPPLPPRPLPATWDLHHHPSTWAAGCPRAAGLDQGANRR